MAEIVDTGVMKEPSYTTLHTCTHIQKHTHSHTDRRARSRQQNDDNYRRDFLLDYKKTDSQSHLRVTYDSHYTKVFICNEKQNVRLKINTNLLYLFIFF